MFRSYTFVFVICMIAISVVDAEVFKWTDSEGNTHYGDAPPSDYIVKELPFIQPPSEEAIKEIEERTGRYEKYIEEQRKSYSPRVEHKSVLPSPIFTKAPECFMTLADSWQDSVSAPIDTITIRPLSKADEKNIRKLFSSLEKRGKATVDGEVCINPNSPQPIKAKNYDVRTTISWKPDNVLKIDAVMREKNSSAVRQEKLNWFFQRGHDLQFTKLETDFSFGVRNLDQNSVEIISIEENRLAYFRRYRMNYPPKGSVRRVDIFIIDSAGGEFVINEYFYSQEILAEKRTWKFSK